MSRIKEFPLPDLGEGLTEGEILAWFVAEGDLITLNQPIVEVETAKAAVEIPAKWAGRVVRIFHPAGSTVEVGAPIIAIDTDPYAVETVPDGPGVSPPSAAALAEVEIASADRPVEPGLIGGPAPGGRTAVLVGYGPKTTTATRRPRKDPSTPAVSVAPAPSVAARIAPAEAAPSVAYTPQTHIDGASPVLAKPPVRKLARELGVDLTGLTGTGPAGTVTRDDVLCASSVDGGRTAAVRAGGVDSVAGQSAAAAFGPDREQRVVVRGVRKLTADNMVASAFTAPHVTEFLTVDVTRSMKALERMRAKPEWRDLRLSPLLLVAKAVLLATQRYPMVNSTWSGATGEIIVKEYVNLGIAAATDRGLIVPNIKDAGRLTMAQLAHELNTLVATAKAGRTAPADMSGGTFTITNVGVFGVDSGTPILPPGEAAILAFGAVRETPWVHKGRVKARQVTTLALSFDHRVIDGELGSRFLRSVGDFLADPEVAVLSHG